MKYDEKHLSDYEFLSIGNGQENFKIFFFFFYQSYRFIQTPYLALDDHYALLYLPCRFSAHEYGFSGLFILIFNKIIFSKVNKQIQ